MTVVKNIGVGGGFTATVHYTDINSWDSYLNALGAFGEDQVGRVLWMSAGNELSVAAIQTLDGSTPGAFQIILEAGDSNGNQGGSFRDHPSKATNPLRYSPSAGACVTTQTFIGEAAFLAINDPNITVRYLQFKNRGTYNWVLSARTDDTGRNVDSCILQQSGASNSEHLAVTRRTGWQNCLLLYESGATTAGFSRGLWNEIGTLGSATNCTFVRTGTAGTSLGVFATYNQMGLTNCAFYGWGDDISAASTGTVTGTNNATDKTAADSMIPSTNAQYGLVGADEWESVTRESADIRLKSTSTKCKEQGTSTGAPAVDIIGQSRS